MVLRGARQVKSWIGVYLLLSRLIARMRHIGDLASRGRVLSRRQGRPKRMGKLSRFVHFFEFLHLLRREVCRTKSARVLIRLTARAADCAYKCSLITLLLRHKAMQSKKQIELQTTTKDTCNLFNNESENKGTFKTIKPRLNQATLPTTSIAFEIPNIK